MHRIAELLLQMYAIVATAAGAAVLIRAYLTRRPTAGCPACSYVRRARAPRCPECARDFLTALRYRDKRRAGTIACGVLLLLSGYGALRAMMLVHRPVSTMLPARIVLERLGTSSNLSDWHDLIQRLEKHQLSDAENSILVSKSIECIDRTGGAAVPTPVLRLVMHNATAGDSRSQQALLRAISRSDARQIIMFLQTVWMEQNTSWAIPFVVDCICHHADDDVRSFAIVTLRAKKQSVTPQDGARALICGLQDPEPMLRSMSAGLLGELDLDDAIREALLQMAETDGDPNVAATGRASRAQIERRR